LVAGGENCSSLAPELPRAACQLGAEVSPWKPERLDLYCEVRTWRWEALGIPSEDHDRSLNARCPLLQGRRANGTLAQRRRSGSLVKVARKSIERLLDAHLKKREAKRRVLFVFLSAAVLVCGSLQVSLACGIRFGCLRRRPKDPDAFTPLPERRSPDPGECETFGLDVVGALPSASPASAAAA